MTRATNPKSKPRKTKAKTTTPKKAKAPKKATAPKAAPKNAKAATPKKTKIAVSAPKTPTKGKKATKKTADAKPPRKLSGYSLFIKEYQPSTASLADKAKAWKRLETEQTDKYAKKAAAWNKKHQPADVDYGTATTTKSTTNAKGVTQTTTATTKLKAKVFEEITKAFHDALDSNNTAVDKMFKSHTTLKQINFPSIKIDKNVQALFNDMIFAAESIYENAGSR